MQHSFQKIALKEIEKISIILQNEGYQVSALIKKLYNYELLVHNSTETVHNSRNQVKVLFYFGKNGVKKILQGNESTDLFRKLKRIIFENDLIKDNLQMDYHPNGTEVDFKEYIGTDESGKGDYFGPLVVAAVYVDESSSLKLNELGVKDSKLLFDNSIKELEKKVQKAVNYNFDIIIINPEKYNKLYESFGNLNKLLGWAHAKAIENLALKINCTNVISDKFGDEHIIKNELTKKKLELNLYQTPKAERYIGVAAASILARAKVIQWFEEKSKEYNYNILKGAGSEVNKIAKIIYSKKGEENLRKLIKFHFKNSKEIF